jgi:hypothetical protein
VGIHKESVFLNHPCVYVALYRVEHLIQVLCYFCTVSRPRSLHVSAPKDLEFGHLPYFLLVVAATWQPSQWKLSNQKAGRRPVQTSGLLVFARTSHLKHKIPGLISITVRGAKTLRALNCVPLWQSANVYLPDPANGRRAWVSAYVHELLTFPNAANDDQVDATTLALNQLCGTLFPESKECIIPAVAARPQHDHYYVIGWIPARLNERSTIVVYDLTDNVVVHFERTPAEPVTNQISHVYTISRQFDNAEVRALSSHDEALLNTLEQRGVYVERVAFTPQELAAAYENLGLLIRNRVISFPRYPDLIAELDVFKSDFTFSRAPDYTMQQRSSRESRRCAS